MTLLCDLAFKYGTDKCEKLGHDYTPVYYDLFKDKRMTIRKVVELGIGHQECMWTGYRTGASLYMWREFFPNAQIIGIDIEDKCQFTDDRITTYKCDQTDKLEFLNTLNSIGKDIDLFVDDGLHLPDAQSSACAMAMPYVKRDGIYIIEDVDNLGKISPNIQEYNIMEIARNIHRYRNDRLVMVTHV